MDLKIKQLDKSHMQHLVDLQQEVHSEEKQKEKLLNSSEEVLESYFKEKGFILGIFHESELIGFSRVWFPELSEVSNSYKTILNLDDQLIRRTAFFRGSCIKKEYRGKKLQKKLYENAIGILTYLGFQYITAKIKIDNLASLKNISELGFINEGIIIKKEKEYYLFRKKIN